MQQFPYQFPHYTLSIPILMGFLRETGKQKFPFPIQTSRALNDSDRDERVAMLAEQHDWLSTELNEFCRECTKRFFSSLFYVNRAFDVPRILCRALDH